MSILGVNPNRDKLAKAIIYGGGYAYFALIKMIASANISNPGAVMKLWSQQSKERKEVKNDAWNIYSETGDILKALKPFIGL